MDSLTDDMKHLSLNGSWQWQKFNFFLRFAKPATVKWTKKTVLAYNKTKKHCAVCDCKVRRGGFAEHLTTRKHKKRFKKLKIVRVA